jgi:HD-GYP domain-containing protein (c-di-GMP phosphodiesterase class II)
MGVTQRIKLRGVGGEVDNKSWEGDTLLRAGRLASLEIVIDDSSVSRRHAEFRSTPQGWRLRDLGSTNGTFLNGARLGAGEWPLRPRDIVRCGNITIIVDAIAETKPADFVPGMPDGLVVEAAEVCSWDEAMDGLIFDRNRCPRPGEQLLAMMRASHHLGHLDCEDDLLHSILNDAVSSLDAQRGAIVLAEADAGPLKLKAVATGKELRGSGVDLPRADTRTYFSHSIALRCFTRGESILCGSIDEDPELAGARSIAEGTMASVLCVLLRTPRKRLGVLHLDRGPLQKPFTRDELHLADALAASVSAGIESAQLLRKQKELFLNSITVLAQAVELRDQYTGGHTQRVTEYSYLLAEALELSASDLNLDIGKIGIDDAILRKPGRLTTGEFEIMKTHTTKGAKILEQVPDLIPIVPIARSHHERWDGKGYPDGLKGEDIHRLARIVAVADAFDAMTSDRPYRAGMPADAAFEEVFKQKGKQFDPQCSEAFLDIREQVMQQMQADTKKIGVNGTLRIAT